MTNGDTYHIGQAAAVGSNPRSDNNTFIQSKEDKQPLSEAAAEIKQILDQLSQTYPTTTRAEKDIVAAKAIEEIKKKSSAKSKIIKALKAGGTAAFVELTNNPVVKILVPMLESLLEEDK